MKRKNALPLLALMCAAAALIILLSGCTYAERSIGTSSLYAAAEIEDAMDAAERYFRREFRGCTLQELCYDEDKSAKAADEWAMQYGEEQAIVLTSTFLVGPGGDGSLERNETYTNWQWILTRSGKNDWVVRTCGYG